MGAGEKRTFCGNLYSSLLREKKPRGGGHSEKERKIHGTVYPLPERKDS